MTRIPFNDGWAFTPTWDDALTTAEGADEQELTAVRLPHTVTSLPLNCLDDSDYQLVSGYVRRLNAPTAWEGKSIRLTLDGAAHQADVYCNGTLVGSHHCGWTAATFDLSEHLRIGGDNVIAIRLDSRETLDQPPFGGVIDYLTYGGLYREAHLDVTGPCYIRDVFVKADHLGGLDAEVQVDSAAPGLVVRARVMTADGVECATTTARADHPLVRLHMDAPNARPWSPDDPALHTLVVDLVDPDRAGEVLDESATRFGFRSIDWRSDGLYINERLTPVRGLNRHQSWPHLGYAAPARAQRLDADILRDELGCTVVRTSHYPQSHHFIDRCDEIGLLVITEIPGWQHIGEDAWKDRAVENTRDMVAQWRNHPSIIAWGVRINESPDDDQFYARTNAAARALDDTRPTTGVRNFAKSTLLEDVYAYNDFVHSGANRGIDPKAKITPDASKGYVVSEHNGHMYPTKSFDDEPHRLSQALRHARVHDDAQGADGVAGAIGWCFADYQTHRDFGSGDQVCHHGVLDMFRNPKLAAAVYASQAERIVLVPSSSMDIGEHPGGFIEDIAVFTNADEVRLYRGPDLVGTYSPDRAAYPHLAHPPIIISDTVGDLLERHEGMDRRTSQWVKQILRDAAKHGAAGMPLATRIKAALLAAAKRFDFDDATRLYNTWVASWGGQAVVWRFDAVRNGEVVACVERTPGRRSILHADVDSTRLIDADTWDMASVRIRLTDEYGAPRTYAHRVIRLDLDGDAELVGPDALPLSGGATGTYIRTLGRAGSARLTISCEGADPVTIDFTIELEEAPTC